MTQAKARRRGQGEDSIYWDASNNRYVGAVSLGFSPAGRRIRRKVTGQTTAEVRDKLRELHQEVASGLRPRRTYSVNDALDDWLTHGLDGVSPTTTRILYQGTIVPMLRQQPGTIRLRDLTASDAQAALTVLAARASTRTLQISRNVLVARSISPSVTIWWCATSSHWSSRPRGSELGGRRSRSPCSRRWPS